MKYVTVTLSDGEPCEVKRLGIYALDGVGPEAPGPFTYTVKLLNGTELTEVYDISRIKNPPVHPGVPESEIVENTPTWHALQEYYTYKAAASYEWLVRQPRTVVYILEVSRYIALKALSEDDLDRIQTRDDWLVVLEAALIPQVTVELVARAFKDSFSAEYDEQEIFDAIRRVKKGLARYDPIRMWESLAMQQYGYSSEEAWGDLSLEERTRKVASVALPQLVESLEADRVSRELAANKNG